MVTFLLSLLLFGNLQCKLEPFNQLKANVIGINYDFQAIQVSIPLAELTSALFTMTK